MTLQEEFYLLGEILEQLCPKVQPWPWVPLGTRAVARGSAASAVLGSLLGNLTGSEGFLQTSKFFQVGGFLLCADHQGHQLEMNTNIHSIILF